MTINFYLHDRNSRKSTLIFLHFRFPTNQLMVFSTRQKIDPKQWNFKKKRAKASKSKPHLSSLNSLLNKVENEITSIYQDCISSDLTPSKGLLRQRLSERMKFDSPTGKTPQKQALSFLDYFDLFISESEGHSRLQKNGKVISSSTIKSYEAVRKHLSDIQRSGSFKFQLKDISNKSEHELVEIKKYYKKFYKVYTDYLYDTLDCFDNTVGKRIKLLRSFFNYLIEEKGINMGSFHKSEFYIPKEDVPIVVISPEQLHYLIYDSELNKSLTPRLSLSRDLFVFGCTVALRISDLCNLTEKNISVEKGNTYLIVKSQKTKTTTKVKLPSYAIDIINRNIGKRSTIFGRSNLNVINTDLRELAKHCNWNKPIIKTRCKRGQEVVIYKDDSTQSHFSLSDLISSHTMRRTAITISLMLGMPEHAVRELSGHSPNSVEFFKYVKLSQSYMDDQYDSVIEKLKGVK
ncbi:MAG: tyrosine-type recombinase/integrase [Reichenbachiella sp.]|uniref:tyrosine-type recombinase/integrase n=1 Tax=Reichenbachiella sp. TaxID=2184521 RepID=UPI003298F923